VLKTQVENNPKSVSPVLELAGYYYASKKRPETVKTLDRLLSNHKDFPDAHMNVGDFYLRLREWEEATHQYQEGMRANPKAKSDYQKRIVEVLIQQGRAPDAARYLAEILKANPKDEQARQWHAQLLLDTGSPKETLEAIAELQSLLVKSPDNAVLRYELGHAYRKNGRAADAEVQFKEAIKIKPDFLPPMIELAQLEASRRDYPAAYQVASGILQLDPANVAGRMIRAGASVGMGKLGEANADVMEAKKVAPQDGSVQFQEGMLQFMEKKYNEAEDTFRKLYQSSDYRGLGGLSEAYAAQNQYERAIQLLQTEAAKAPENSTIRLYLANIAARAQKYDLAVAQFTALIAQDPKREDLYLRLAETYRRSGDLNSAAENFRKAKDLDPTDWQAQLKLALLLEGMGRKEEAKKIYDTVLKLQPDNPTALNNLAFSMAESGEDLDQALTLAQRAQRKWPGNPDVADTLGWIYVRKNLSDSAVDIFRDLVAKQPKNPIYRYHYAVALYQKGDKLNAKKEAQTALASTPPKDEESKIKELIAKIG
jgi:tetratricopeptide (TPR) repeat protein